jgi:hypothetical protein
VRSCAGWCAAKPRRQRPRQPTNLPAHGFGRGVGQSHPARGCTGQNKKDIASRRCPAADRHQSPCRAPHLARRALFDSLSFDVIAWGGIGRERWRTHYERNSFDVTDAQGWKRGPD